MILDGANLEHAATVRMWQELRLPLYRKQKPNSDYYDDHWYLWNYDCGDRHVVYPHQFYTLHPPQEETDE